MMSVVRTIVVEESGVVAGEPEQVFDLVADDSNFFVLRPDAVAHRDLVSLPTGGHSCVQVYQLKKRRIEQRSVNQVFERPTRMVDTAETPWSSSVVTMSFERASGGGRSCEYVRKPHRPVELAHSRPLCRGYVYGGGSPASCRH